MKRLVPFALILGLTGCGPSSCNLENVKQHAPETWKSLGYNVSGYEGYQFGFTSYLDTQYGGAHVWYTLTRPDSPGVVFTGSLQRWGTEYQNTSLRALNALSGH